MINQKTPRLIKRQITHAKLVQNQKGFASLIIALVMIIVLGLLTIGFAELMRHSQQQETSRHLSDQAYYAAESGVNDAVRAINGGYDQAKDTCAPLTMGPSATPGTKYLTSNKVGSASDPDAPSWTCLLIDPTPPSLEYDGVGTVTPKTFILKPVNSTGGSIPLSSLTIGWQDSSNPPTHNFKSPYNGSIASFSSVGSWGAPGILRISITPLSSVDRVSLVQNTYTAFLYPGSGAATSGTFSSHTGLSSDSGQILNGGCSTGNTPNCQVSISGFPSDTKYLVTLRSIYSATDVKISAPGGTSFSGAQTMIDSTGKAQNVLKRLRVRVPTKKSYDAPGFVMDATGSICKHFSANPSNPPTGICNP